jgi:hypothetical protein
MSSVKAGVALLAGFVFFLKAVFVFFPFRRGPGFKTFPWRGQRP